MVTNQEMNKHREPGCWAVLADKKYFEVGNSCIKRTLRRHEWQSSSFSEDLDTTPTTYPKQWKKYFQEFIKRILRRHEWQSPFSEVLLIPPTSYPQRWKTDAAILRYLSEHTDIPLPRLQCTFEDDGAFYICTEFVEGVSMDELSEEAKRVVTQEILQHTATLRSLRSDIPGVPGEPLMCPPQRVMGRWKPDSCWRPRKVKGEYVFCHNDLAQHNVIVDPKTLKIAAIIDWEFGGFWPEWFERPFWERCGPSAALEGEEDDVDRCREWLISHCDEVVMPHLRGLSEKLVD